MLHCRCQNSSPPRLMLTIWFLVCLIFIDSRTSNICAMQKFGVYLHVCAVVNTGSNSNLLILIALCDVLCLVFIDSRTSNIGVMQKFGVYLVVNTGSNSNLIILIALCDVFHSIPCHTICSCHHLSICMDCVAPNRSGITGDMFSFAFGSHHPK